MEAKLHKRLKHTTTKFLEKNVQENLCYLGLGKELLDLTSKAHMHKRKN